MFIYKITNTINHKVYIGQTKNSNIEKRFWSHRNALNKNKHVNQHLQFSWIKYGHLAFTFEVVEMLSPEQELNTQETLWINEYKSFDQFKGYNLTKGGAGATGHSHSQKARDAIGEASRVRGGGRVGGNKLIGRKRCPIASAATALKNTGKKRTPEWIKNMSDSKKKAIIDSTGKEHSSIKEAAAFYSVYPSCISRILKKERDNLNGITFSHVENKGI